MASEVTPLPLSVLILAGGRSQRMGQDKLWMLLDGAPLVERVVGRVLPIAGEILFSANAPERFEPLAAALRGQGLPAQVVADLHPGSGPLAGIHAGLSAARHDALLALAGDMPFINLALAAWMASLAPGFDAVAPQTARPEGSAPAWEPLHAVYRRTCLPAITARLAAGERRVQCFFPDIRVRAVSAEEVARYDPAGLSFFNVNTPDDWRRAQTLSITGTYDHDPATHL